jgi:hypothetical protein
MTKQTRVFCFFFAKKKALFFFEKKNQKTFAPSGFGINGWVLNHAR